MSVLRSLKQHKHDEPGHPACGHVCHSMPYCGGRSDFSVREVPLASGRRDDLSLVTLDPETIGALK